jgi:hypothetical protein
MPVCRLRTPFFSMMQTLQAILPDRLFFGFRSPPYFGALSSTVTSARRRRG